MSTKSISRETVAEVDSLHEMVQQVLLSLAARVQERLPAIRYQPGRNSARSWLLFSYCVFTWPDEADLEGVVAGVTLSQSTADGAVTVQGEICGEETGYSYYRTQKRDPSTGVPQHVRDSALELSNQEEIVVEALQARRRASDLERP